MMKRMVLVAVLVVACKGKGNDKDKAGGSSDDCKAVGAAVGKVWTDKAAAATSDQERDFATRMATAAAARIEQHCLLDKWSADAIACAKAGGDFSKCSDKLTPDQMEKLKMSAPPAWGGSSAGSAGSGSN